MALAHLALTMNDQVGFEPREQRLNSNASDTTISDAGDAGDAGDTGASITVVSQVKRRKRVNMTAHQTRTLNSVFERTCFPSAELRQELARQLGLDVRAVQVWFQNRRQRLRESNGLVRGRQHNCDRQITRKPQFAAQAPMEPVGHNHTGNDATISSSSPPLSLLQPSLPFAPTYYPPYQWFAGFPPTRHSRTRSDISPHVAAAIRNDIYRRHLGYQMFSSPPPPPPPPPFYYPQLHHNAAPLIPLPMSVGSPGEFYPSNLMKAPPHHPFVATPGAIGHLGERKRNST